MALGLPGLAYREGLNGGGRLIYGLRRIASYRPNVGACSYMLYGCYSHKIDTHLSCQKCNIKRSL